MSGPDGLDIFGHPTSVIIFARTSSDVRNSTNHNQTVEVWSPDVGHVGLRQLRATQKFYLSLRFRTLHPTFMLIIADVTQRPPTQHSCWLTNVVFTVGQQLRSPLQPLPALKQRRSACPAYLSRSIAEANPTPAHCHIASPLLSQICTPLVPAAAMGIRLEVHYYRSKYF